MNDIWEALCKAVTLVLSLDSDLLEIVGLSLRLSFTAVLISLVIGLPLAALLALTQFPGRRILIVATNVFMGLPPVVVGLIVYVVLSRSGPLVKHTIVSPFSRSSKLGMNACKLTCTYF